MKSNEVKPILMNLRAPSPKNRDSPRCMLRIPEAVTPSMLKVPGIHLPGIVRAQSHSNSPLPLSPRVAKNKDIEFPEIRDRVLKERDDLNAKVIRGIKKHSSDKGIRMTKDQEENDLRFPNWKVTQEELARQGIYIIKS